MDWFCNKARMSYICERLVAQGFNTNPWRIFRYSDASRLKVINMIQKRVTERLLIVTNSLTELQLKMILMFTCLRLEDRFVGEWPGLYGDREFLSWWRLHQAVVWLLQDCQDQPHWHVDEAEEGGGGTRKAVPILPQGSHQCRKEKNERKYPFHFKFSVIFHLS